MSPLKNSSILIILDINKINTFLLWDFLYPDFLYIFIVGGNFFKIKGCLTYYKNIAELW